MFVFPTPNGTGNDGIQLDTIQLNAGFDAFFWQPITASSSAKNDDTHQHANNDSCTVSKQTLFKIHTSKLIGYPIIPSDVVNSGIMIETSNLSFRYSADSPELTFPDLSCPTGEQLLLLGDSGCGKTTLLHLLCGILKPAQGKVLINGQNLGLLTGKNLDRFRGTHVGLVFQRSHFVQSLSVLENLALPYFLTGQTADLDHAQSLLDTLGVGHKAKSRPQDLSVGEQQRASIARALVHRPAVLLADEPTSALDDRSTQAVLNLLEEQAAQAGATLIIVTHDQRLKDRYDRKVELKSLAILAS